MTSTSSRYQRKVMSIGQKKAYFLGKDRRRIKGKRTTVTVARVLKLTADLSL